MRRLLVARLERHLTRTTAPRLQMLVLVLVTSVVGLLTSVWLRHLHVNQMVHRYPISVVVAYGAVLSLVWMWIILQQKALGPDSEDCGHLANEARRGSSLRRSAASNAEFPEPVGGNPVRFGRVCGYYARRRWGSLDLLCDLVRGFRYRARPRIFGRNFSRWRLLRGAVSAVEPN
jgi:hypothetical protein